MAERGPVVTCRLPAARLPLSPRRVPLPTQPYRRPAGSPALARDLARCRCSGRRQPPLAVAVRAVAGQTGYVAGRSGRQAARAHFWGHLASARALPRAPEAAMGVTWRGRRPSQTCASRQLLAVLATPSSLRIAAGSAAAAAKMGWAAAAALARPPPPRPPHLLLLALLHPQRELQRSAGCPRCSSLKAPASALPSRHFPAAWAPRALPLRALRHASVAELVHCWY